MNAHVHPTIANVLNQALGQPANHAGGTKLAAAVDALKPDACGEPMPPVVLGNPGFHTDENGKAIDTELSATFRDMVRVCQEMPRDERGDARAFRMIAELLADNSEMMVAILATETSPLNSCRMLNKAVRVVLAERPRR